jgi:type 1 glutamine amidotransferase
MPSARISRPKRSNRDLFSMTWVIGLICFVAAAAQVRGDDSTHRVIIVAGPDEHAPGTHEIVASARLLEHCLEHAANLPSISAQMFTNWPGDPRVKAEADTVVFLGDTFPPQRFSDSDRILTELGSMMDRGCGIVCIHYATGLLATDVEPEGAHPLLGWMGGYFATRCQHHQSVARIFREATITPASADHPVSRGWEEFTLHDEPYINMYFDPAQEESPLTFTPIATSLLPPESPTSHVVAWTVERSAGGRGFAVVMPHFYRNWRVEDLRRLILNGIVWSSGHPVPVVGVQTPPPDLKQFQPKAISPPPNKP